MRLSPKDFWSLTPAEWRWLIEAATPAGGAGMSAGELATLALQYPDEASSTPVAPSDPRLSARATSPVNGGGIPCGGPGVIPPPQRGGGGPRRQARVGGGLPARGEDNGENP